MPIEAYRRAKNRLIRTVMLPGQPPVRSQIESRADPPASGADAWWQSFIRGAELETAPADLGRPRLQCVDAFSGCGGLMLGATQAALATGRRLAPALAIDIDLGCLQAHRANFGTAQIVRANVSSLVDFHIAGTGRSARLAYPPEILHPSFAQLAGDTDLFVAGPPCQGHSNLNNKTRRNDPRNLLYLGAAALAVALRARAVVLENVAAIASGDSDTVEVAAAALAAAGYSVETAILALERLGGPQTRHRHFLLALRRPGPAAVPLLAELARSLQREPRPVRWAIGDLARRRPADFRPGFMDDTPALSDENRARIEFLFAHKLYDLPNAQRPACHRDGHTYEAVYGRLRWNKPAGTITTGFLTPGRGRFIHPSRPRVISPREAARLQMLPDSFRFSTDALPPTRLSIAKWIGDAVPPLLGYTAALPLIASL